MSLIDFRSRFRRQPKVFGPYRTTEELAEALDIAPNFAEEVRAEIKRESLLDRSKSAVSSVIAKMKAEETRLIGEITEREEQLRQVRIVIEAQSAAGDILEGKDAA